MAHLALTLFADYFQFYLQDEKADGDLSESWSEEAVTDLLATAPGTIGVGTVRNMDVPLLVEVRDGRPPDDLDQWDHVTECSIEVPTGRLVIAGCTDYFPDAQRLELAPGTYRARVFYGGLATLSADGLEGRDHYKVSLWPGPAEPSVVLKRWASSHAP
jgi:hypothetical protein